MQRLMNEVRRAGTRLAVVKDIQQRREAGETAKELFSRGANIRDMFAAGMTVKIMLQEGVSWQYLLRKDARLRWQEISMDMGEVRALCPEALPESMRQAP